MILALIIGFILGIFLASVIHIKLAFIVAVAVLSGLTYFYKYFDIEKQNKIILCSVFLFGMVFGMGRIFVSDYYKQSHLDKYVGQKIVAEGIVVDEPDVREDNTKLTVNLLNVTQAGVTTPVRENVLVTVPIYPDFSYGDKIKMNLVLEEPKGIESDGRVFDYKGYLRVRGIWYTSRFTRGILLSLGHGSLIKTWLFKVKHAFVSGIDNALPEPESSLMSGLLLGGKQSLGKDLLSEFQRTGTSHIVVLSGYNIAIVAESIMALLAFLPSAVSFGFGTLSIILFTILSGGGASAWRAAIMVLVALFGKKLNREYEVTRAFGFAVVLMLAQNPTLLVFDPSFQLSILATIGIVFVSPLMAPYFIRITERFGAREIVCATVATQIVVLPYLIYTTGIVSLVSLPVNVLILGTIPITMLFGFLTGIVGLVSLYLSFIPALPAYVLLWYQLTIVHLGSIIPFGAINLPGFSPIILVLVYTGIFIGLYFLKNKNNFTLRF